MRQQLTIDGTPTSLDMLIKYINDSAKNYKSRAPEIAKFELSQKTNSVPDAWESIDVLVQNYISRFGGKQCTYFDLEPYLPMLPRDNGNKIIETLINQENDNHDPNPDNACCKHILPYLLKVFFISFYFCL